MKVLYIISNELDYSRLVSGDAGPRFADEYGWQCCTLRDLQDTEADILIVDNRVQESEFRLLEEFQKTRRTPMFFRISDPFEYVINEGWFKFVAKSLERDRSHLMLTYLPTGATSYLLGASRRTKFVFAPYVYDETKERRVDHTGRKGRVLLSGMVDGYSYPVRTAYARWARFCPPLRSRTDVLAHPGYSEMTGKPFSHDIIGNRFVDKIAEYKFAFACSTRSRIEILKYREIAYAGSVVVGDMPYSLLDVPSESYVAWRRNPFALARDIASAEEGSEERAVAFRTMLKRCRDKKVVCPWVERQLIEQA